MVFTTHQVQDRAHCDRIVVLARDGYVAFVDTAEDACRYFETRKAEEIYERLDREATPTARAQRFAGHRHEKGATTVAPPTEKQLGRRASPVGVHPPVVCAHPAHVRDVGPSPLTLAILLGSPALVVAMFAILFRPGSIGFNHPSPSAITMILF